MQRRLAQFFRKPHAEKNAGEERVPRRPGGPGVYAGLRALAISATAEKLGACAPGKTVLVLLADLAVGDRHATIMCSVDGTASVYGPMGGGVIGAGQKSREVRDAAIRAVEIGAKLEAELPVVAPDPGLPEPGWSRLTLVTTQGLRSAAGPMEAIVAGKHLLSPLFFEANRVITHIRRATPEMLGDGRRPREPERA